MESDLQEKVVDEIRRIPIDRLPQLYDIIHFFRLSLEIDRQDKKKDVMRFAGCWEDMTEKDFNDLSNDITERRRKAFSGRMDHESIID
jgi:hypothetical protein